MRFEFFGRLIRSRWVERSEMSITRPKYEIIVCRLLSLRNLIQIFRTNESNADLEEVAWKSSRERVAASLFRVHLPLSGF